MAGSIGLIAGLGRFPMDVARGARERGHRVLAIAFHELTDPALEAEVDRFEWLYLGQLERLLSLLREEGAADVVMAGKVPKTFLWSKPGVLRPDARALAVLSGMADRKDDSLLRAVADVLIEEGHRLLGQVELAPQLRAPEGLLGRVEPTPEQREDIAFGWPVAKALGALDVGQSVVVRGGAVLALEAIEGTDAAIRRGCALGEKGACVVKVAKPSQDPRFDVPTIGPDTIGVLVEGEAAVLAIEAGQTVVLDRESVVREADAHGIAVVGVVAPPGEQQPS